MQHKIILIELNFVHLIYNKLKVEDLKNTTELNYTLKHCVSNLKFYLHSKVLLVAFRWLIHFSL